MFGRQVLASVGMSMGLVVQWRVMLGVTVAPVESPGGPRKTELILGGAAAQPVKPNVHIFGLASNDCVVSDSVCGVVVIFKGGSWLQPTHFSKCLA